ncbi:MAG: hypothetical protein P4L51_16665 [Puia sp.]|nr:hypothetical protein [Puia sp.]
MDDLFDALKPKPSIWYSSSGVYEGNGTVFSETLGRTIDGRFLIDWDDLGKLSIRCTPTNIELPDCMRIAEDFDKFHDLRVVTGDGIFRARQCYLNGPTLSFGAQGGSVTLKFSTLACALTASEHSVPSTWNVPITNFLMDLRLRPGTCDRHPLRIYPTPLIPEDFPSDKMSMARLIANSKNRLVTFEFNGSTAFIEHLAAYDDAEADLKHRRNFNRVTSMMVGNIPSEAGLGPEEVQEWFPSDIFFGLTFASGSRIGMGPIELRTQDGRLYARIHLAFASGRYTDGHMTVSDLVHSDGAGSGLGHFLTCLLQASAVSMRRIRLLAAAIDLSQDALETPDHAFAFIVRALDGLANDLKLARSNLKAELSEIVGNQVRNILLGASKSIRRLSKGGSSCLDPKAQSALARIADRALSADSTDDKFGLSLGRILSHYKLDDEAAITSFYAKHPRSDGFGWTQVLDSYRGGTIHRGFIDYSAGIEIMDVVCCTRHLVDIAIRICLREMGYGGTYNPINMAATQQCPIDWVKTELDIELFGYNGMIPKMIKFVEQAKPS